MITYKEMEERAVRELICGLCDDCHKRLNVCLCAKLCGDHLVPVKDCGCQL
jgi:hypothetical protein